MKDFLKKELSGWTPFETMWLFLASASLLALSIYWGDTWYGIVSAVSGVVCVVLTGKGKLSAYAFGVVNCALYGFISYRQALYGDAMLNILYYLPLQFYGFAVWRHNMDGNASEVKRLRMGWLERVDKAVALTIGTAVYGMVLAVMRDPLPYADSFTTCASVLAMWLSCRRYVEQWYLWLAVDVVSVWMWWNRYCAGGDNIATLLMWVVFLLNAVYGCLKWEIAARKDIQHG